MGLGILVDIVFGPGLVEHLLDSPGSQIAGHFCEPDENDCFRQWVSALSGWVGGLVAFVALWPIYLQLREMKRQTNFTVGDDLPTVEIWTNNNSAVYRFRVVNWNRRAFLIYEVRWIKAPKFEAEQSLRVDRETADREGVTERVCEVDNRGVLAAWAVVEGWEDRGRPPDAKRFWRLATKDPTTVVFADGTNMAAEVEIVGELAGETRRRIRIRAKAPTLIDLSPSRGGPDLYVGKIEEARSNNDESVT